MVKLFFIISALAFTSASAGAQAVRITAQSVGQGLMIKDNGICWVLMPRHLLGEFGQFTIETTPAPSVFGIGTAYAEFWDGMDLAIGSVEQSAGTTACTASIDLVTEQNNQIGSILYGELRFAQPGGAITQLPMRIVDTLDHKLFTAEFSNPDDRAFQGLSGAFLFAQGKPLGMAIQSDDGEKRMIFIRIEEIGFAFQRWLSGRSRAVVSMLEEPTKNPFEDSLDITLLQFDTPSISPETTPGNLADRTGAYHFEFTGRASFTFRLEDGSGVGVSRVRMISEGPGAKPLDVRIFIDATAQGDDPEYFSKGQMSPTGMFDTGEKGERLASSVTIVIESVQGEGPVRIDQIFIN